VEQQERVEKKEPPRGGSRRSTRIRYSPDQKLKAVRLVLEEGFSRALVSQEIGVCKTSLVAWIDKYRAQGEAGLRAPRAAPVGQDKLPAAITEQIVALKREHPAYGVKRIAQVLRRLFWLPASAETVRQRLHRQGLLPPTKAARPRNLTRPRFFERATPNQMIFEILRSSPRAFWSF
jgi:transposase-like protein